MTQHEVERYRDRLNDLSARLRGAFSGLAEETLRPAGGEASGNLSDTPVHLADMASDTFAEETNLGLMEMEGRSLEAVSAALQRIQDGTYGTCLRCGTGIGKARLDAMPEASHCIDCARKVEDRTPLVESPGSL